MLVSQPLSLLQLLQLLYSQQGNWLALEAMEIALKLPRNAIRQRIDELSELGYQIESNPAFGFRMVSAQSRLSCDLIETNLPVRLIGRKVLIYDTTSSTNDIAWQYAKESGYEGLAVFTEFQSSGRGRAGHCWQAPAGSSLLFSVLIPNLPDITPSSLTLVAAVSTAIAIENITDLAISIKWPNDIILESKKLAGVMVEAKYINAQQFYVVGIGLNVYQQQDDLAPEIRNTAISLLQAGVCVDRNIMARQILTQLDSWLQKLQLHSKSALHSQWSRRCYNIGRRIKLASNGKTCKGRVVDIDVEKGLLVQLDNGSVKFFEAATSTVLQDGCMG